MALDEAARTKLAEHLQKTWRSPGCVLCGSTTWELHGYVTIILSDAPGASAGTEGLPACALVCQRCGNTVIINLVVADALPAA